MNSQEVKQLCGGFLAQVRGVFAGIEKLPLAFEELERREQALPSLTAQVTVLNREIARKTEELRGVENAVQVKTHEEHTRQRKELTAQLAGLTDQIAVEEGRAAAAKTAADQEEARLRSMHDHLATLGLTPLERP
jgi:chromosome segregation ATPase